MAAWLLSDRASMVTGAIVPVDGGAGAEQSATVMAWRCTNLTRTTSWSRAVRRCGCRGGSDAPGGFRPRLAAVAWRGHPWHCRADRRAGGRVRARLPASGAGRPAVAGGTVAGDSRWRRPLGRGRFRRAGVSAAASRGPGLLLQPGRRATVRAGPDRRGVLGPARPGAPARRGGDQPLRDVGHPRAGQAHPPARRAAPGLAAVGALRRPLAVLAGSGRRHDRLRQVVDGRGGGGSATPAGAAVLRRTALPGSAPPSGCWWRARARCRCSSASATRRTGGRTPLELAGFPNLGQVTYTGCKGSSSGGG